MLNKSILKIVINKQTHKDTYLPYSVYLTWHNFLKKDFYNKFNEPNDADHRN